MLRPAPFLVSFSIGIALVYLLSPDPIVTMKYALPGAGTKYTQRGGTCRDCCSFLSRTGS